ncbi:BnaA10g13200D [Brassica napus]|uniref:BnaA10g13200D protein n=1 Tax=Brassica napus TaxID=3708 RepID=A0A078H1C1_BRANA|nr:BnaA10g13200D [Brassica napus]
MNFCCFCFKKKKETVPDGAKEPEVKIQQQDEGKRPINIKKASKPLNGDASSSNGTASQNYSFLEQAKGVGAGVGAAAQVNAIGVGAAENVKAIGKGAFNLLPNNIKGYFGKKNDRKEPRAVKPQQWKEEEEMRQKRIRQEKEEENRRQRDLAEEKRKQEKIRQEKEEEERRKRASENNSGETSMVAGITGSLWNTISTVTNATAQALETVQRSTSTQAQRTGETSTSTHTQGTWRPSTSTHTQGTWRPSTSTQNPYSSQRGNTTS